MAAIRVWIGPLSPPRDAKAPKATAKAASPNTSRDSASIAAMAGEISAAPASGAASAPGMAGTPPSAKARLTVARASNRRCSEMAANAVSPG
jgi:hypothetical protein